MGNRLVRTKQERIDDALAKRPASREIMAKKRLALINLTKITYEGSVFNDVKIKERIHDLRTHLAQNAFDQGRFKDAVALATNDTLRGLFNDCRLAYQRLDSPMCGCVETDKETGAKVEPKGDIRSVFMPKEDKTIVFVLCAACSEVFAVTIDDANPISKLEKVPPSERQLKRRVDKSREVRKLLTAVN